jgi:microcystin-dependent protein
MPFAGTTAPQGWMLCDGSAVSRTTYAALFAVIGTTYGEGDGETTFNIPNLAGRVVIGSSQSHALGTTGGSETVTLTADQLPAHTHVVPKHGHGNDIAVKTPVLSHEITSQPMYKYNKPNSSKAYSIARTNAINGTSTQTASRTTDVSIADHDVELDVGGSISPCDSFDSGSYGGNSSHNNMQPYTSINYLICTGE